MQLITYPASRKLLQSFTIIPVSSLLRERISQTGFCLFLNLGKFSTIKCCVWSMFCWMTAAKLRTESFAYDWYTSVFSFTLSKMPSWGIKLHKNSRQPMRWLLLLLTEYTFAYRLNIAWRLWCTYFHNLWVSFWFNLLYSGAGLVSGKSIGGMTTDKRFHWAAVAITKEPSCMK